MKAPRIPPAAKTFAKKAVDDRWDHAQFLAAVLAEEVAARETHGGQARIKAARFPEVKTVDDFDFTFHRSVKPAQIARLAPLDFLHEASNVVFLGPEQGRRICRSHWVWLPRVGVIGWRSRPRTSGLTGRPPPTAPGDWT